MGPETMDTIWNIKGALWISENIIFHCEVVQAHCAVLLLRDSKNYGCVPDQFAVGGPSWAGVAGPDGLQRSLLTSTILQICVWEESIQQNINKDTKKPLANTYREIKGILYTWKCKKYITSVRWILKGSLKDSTYWLLVVVVKSPDPSFPGHSYLDNPQMPIVIR